MSVSKKPKLMAPGHPDNFQSPLQAGYDIATFLPSRAILWEPAAGKGNLVKALSEREFVIRATDILYEESQDFMAYDHTKLHFDIIVTNPPFSIKQKFLARCYQIGKPFALLMPLTTFDSKERRQLFRDKGIQLVLPDYRYNFETPNNKGSSAWFYTAWFCWGLNLPNEINYVGFDDQPTFMERINAKRAAFSQSC